MPIGEKRRDSNGCGLMAQEVSPLSRCRPTLKTVCFAPDPRNLRLFDMTQEARVTFETVFEPVLVSLEARPACHGAKGGLQRRLRSRGRRSVSCVGA
jgi:hypothetical protein